MKNGIEIIVDWWDEDFIVFILGTSNGRFRGETTAYVGPHTLVELAESLSGFPSRPTDHREFELGASEPFPAGGGIEMRFHCLDAAGHAVVDAKLRSDGCKAVGELESVALRIPLETAAVDSFVEQIRNFEQSPVATLRLAMAD